jgi:hypothetical protein
MLAREQLGTQTLGLPAISCNWTKIQTLNMATTLSAEILQKPSTFCARSHESRIHKFYSRSKT